MLLRVIAAVTLGNTQSVGFRSAQEKPWGHLASISFYPRAARRPLGTTSTCENTSAACDASYWGQPQSQLQSLCRGALRGMGEGTVRWAFSGPTPGRHGSLCRISEVSGTRLAQRKQPSCTLSGTAEQLGTSCSSSLQTLGLAMHLIGKWLECSAKPSGLPLREKTPNTG